MRFTLSRLRVLVAGLLLGATPLIAQNDAPQPAAEGEPLFQPKNDEVPVARFQQTAEEYLVEMRAGLTKGLDILREAREDMDALRLQCVNDKITAMKGILRISEDANISLQEALATRATERARYEFNKIRTSRNKMAEMLSAAQNCVGAEATYTGGSDLTVEVDPAVIAQDPYYGDPNFFFTPEETLANPPGDTVGTDEPPDARPPIVSVYQG